jgi:hypothetical protein
MSTVVAVLDEAAKQCLRPGPEAEVGLLRGGSGGRRTARGPDLQFAAVPREQRWRRSRTAQRTAGAGFCNSAQAAANDPRGSPPGPAWNIDRA